MSRVLHGAARLLMLLSIVAGVFVVLFPYRPEVEFFFLHPGIKQFLPAPTWLCGDDSRCAAVAVAGYATTISADEQRAGITEQWCLSYTHIRKHTGVLAPVFRWAYQNRRPMVYRVRKIEGHYQWQGVARELYESRFSSSIAPCT
jgi:hypothetical protein